MNDVKRTRRRSWFVLLAAWAIAACEREPPAPAAPSTSQPKSAAIARETRSRPAPVGSVAPVTLNDAPAPRGIAGEWIDAKMYRIRVGRVLRCEAPSVKQAGEVVRLGVEVEIAARADNVFVAPRDVALARDGVIVESLHAATVPKGCLPLFQPTTLKEGKSASGLVLFDTPDSEFARAASLTFRPTRWGGAPLTEVKLPAYHSTSSGGASASGGGSGGGP